MLTLSPQYCCYCQIQIKEKTWELYFLSLNLQSTPVKVVMPINEAISIINDFANENFIHMSATEILFLRPDIVMDVFEPIYHSEGLVAYTIISFPICKSCYEIWKTKNPLM